MSGIIKIKGERSGKEFVVDLSDKLQTKYEMVRELRLNKLPKEEICKKYGYTRATGHIYEKGWEKQRWEGLKDKKKGPKINYKRLAVEEKVLSLRFKDKELDMYDISDLLREKGFDISSRTVARILSEHGVTLKKKRRKI